MRSFGVLDAQGKDLRYPNMRYTWCLELVSLAVQTLVQCHDSYELVCGRLQQATKQNMSNCGSCTCITQRFKIPHYQEMKAQQLYLLQTLGPDSLILKSIHRE